MHVVQSKLDNVKKVQANESFHHAIGPCLLFGQFFGLLPVQGVLNRDEKKLKFQWKNFRTIYSIAFLISGSIDSCTGIRRLFRLGFNIRFAEGILFFMTSIFRACFLFYFAMNWNEIIAKWKKCEEAFLQSPYEVKGWKLKTKIRLIFFIIIFVQVVEHVFFMTAALYDNYIQINECNPRYKDFWANFFYRERPHLRYHFSYSPAHVLFYVWVNLLETFSWIFSDSFVVILAVGITFRLNQFKDFLELKVVQNEKLMTKDTWRKLRIDYVQLMELIYFIDSWISILLLISLGHSMLIIVLKIFQAFLPNRHNTLDELYFWYFVGTLVWRTLCVLLYTAQINDVVSKPLEVIRNIPTQYWTLDLKRLHDTIFVETPTLGFSGWQLFYVTKNLILGFCATIVTYEIFLLDQAPHEKSSICDLLVYM